MEHDSPALLFRLTGSLKFGLATASLLVGKLSASRRRKVVIAR